MYKYSDFDEAFVRERNAQFRAQVTRRIDGSLTEDEFRMIRTLAGAAAKEIDELLLSADRFVNSPSHTGLTDLERQHLLSRFGVFGIRV